MKKIILITILAAALNTVLFGQNIYTVTKVTDPDPFDHPYSFNDALCDTAMYGTLQWAIRKTNDAPPPSEIRFNIAGTGQHIINLNFTLPPVDKQVSIDGSTQLGYNYNNGPSIIIDGTNIPIYNYCFNFTSNDDSSTVKGIHIQNFWASAGVSVWTGNIKIKDCMFWNVGGLVWPWRNTGIYIAGPNAIIQGNILGTDITGTQDHGCLGGAIHLQNQYLPADNCLIGGSGANQQNLVAYSDNGYGGVTIINGKYNLISRNKIYYDTYRGINLLIYAGSDWWGNEAKPAPVIDTLTPSGILSGTSQANDVVEIFGSAAAQNANEYITATTADAFGNWSATMTNFNWQYFIATATDAANNTSELSNAYEITITPIILSFITTDASCNGVNNGAIDLTVTGGIPPYIYLWSNGAITEDIDSLFANTHFVSVTDNAANIEVGIAVVSEADTNSADAAHACKELFISEYVEGTTHNTALEFFNPSEDTIILNRYFVRVFMNGAPTPLITQLSGILFPGKTHVISNPNADAAILTKANQTSNKINFNGDDAIQFVKVLNNINFNIDSIEGLGQNPHDIFDTLQLDTLDQIGITDVYPGNSGWPVGNASTKDATLIRNYGVTRGKPDWACGQYQWKTFAQNTFDSLGIHHNKCVKNLPFVTLRFQNPSQTTDTITGKTYFEFDIEVKASDTGAYYFNSAQFFIIYDTVSFGSIANITIQRGDLITDSATYNEFYVINWGQNVNGQKVFRTNIQVSAPNPSPNRILLPTSFGQLAHYIIEIDSCFHYSGLTFDTTFIDTITGNHYDGLGFAPTETEPVTPGWTYGGPVYENEMNVTLCELSISDFSPNPITAGTNSLLTIQGIGFGATRGNGLVALKNADNGGASYIRLDYIDYKYWSENEIKIIVPSRVDTLSSNPLQINYNRPTAGSGEIYVKINSGDSVISDSPLIIPYSILNNSILAGMPGHKKLRYQTVSVNDSGGYTFRLDTSITNTPIIEAIVRNVIKDWSCATKINFRIGPDTTFSYDPDSLNGVSSIFLSNSLHGIPAGQASGKDSKLWFSGGDTTLLFKEIDVAISRDFDSITGVNLHWFYDTTHTLDVGLDSIDMYGVLLHELGHAHLLDHENDNTELMYYSVSPGPIPVYLRKTLTPDAISGAENVMYESALINLTGCPYASLMIPYTNPDCAIFSINENNFTPDEFNIFPNPFGIDGFTITYQLNETSNLNFIITDITGKTFFSKNHPDKLAGTYMEQINTEHLANGLYIFIGNINGSITTKKIIKL